MKSPAVVILAAGMGSRFGGDKQLTEVGPRGETILELNALDAAAAGFESLVVVTRPELEPDVRDRLSVFGAPAFRGAVAVAIQSIPDGRAKPLGTADAVVRAAPFVAGAFAVANADDLYGQGSFAALADHLVAHPAEAAVIGYRLGDTLSDQGTVSRAILDTGAGNALQAITETTVGPSGADQERLVSMNLWAFPHSALALIDREVDTVIREGADEAMLPEVVNRLLAAKTLAARVLPTRERWIGMTYSREVEEVRRRLRATGS